MANPLPNEKEVYQQIAKDKLVISRRIWQYLFDNVEDVLSKVALILTSFYDAKQEMPVADLKNISQDVQIVSKVINKMLHPEKIKTEDDKFVIIESESENIPEILKHLIRHHVGNDIQAIQFILSVYIDEGSMLSLEDNVKVATRLRNIKTELEKIKEHTETMEDRIKNYLNHPIAYVKFLLANPRDINHKKLEEILRDLESVKNLFD